MPVIDVGVSEGLVWRASFEGTLRMTLSWSGPFCPRRMKFHKVLRVQAGSTGLTCHLVRWPIPTLELYMNWVRLTPPDALSLGCVRTRSQSSEMGTSGCGQIPDFPALCWRCSKSCLVRFCPFRYLVNQHVIVAISTRLQLALRCLR